MNGHVIYNWDSILKCEFRIFRPQFHAQSDTIDSYTGSTKLKKKMGQVRLPLNAKLALDN